MAKACYHKSCFVRSVRPGSNFQRVDVGCVMCLCRVLSSWGSCLKVEGVVLNVGGLGFGVLPDLDRNKKPHQNLSKVSDPDRPTTASIMSSKAPPSCTESAFLSSIRLAGLLGLVPQ